MEDKQIIDLFWARSENAIQAASNKYSRYCRYIASRILHNDQDAEECVNDTYMKAWQAIPPARPDCLSAFLGRLTRNIALNMLDRHNSSKRGSGQVPLVLDELEECIPSGSKVDQAMDDIALRELLNSFLEELPAENRKLFMRRYWYLSSIKEISMDYGISESKVKMSLLRTRNKLKEIIEREGMDL